MKIYLKMENKENINKKIFDINNNISFFNKNKNFEVQFIDIKKEIKKRSNTLKRYFNIKNSIFKEMQSKYNSLIYQELVNNMGNYFFGPYGKVTEKYKFLRDYYINQDMKMGFNSKILAGTLDYYSLLSDYDSYTQRINSTKEQLLFSSRNLAVAKSGFDIIDQSALSNNKLFNKRKNFVDLNIKSIKNLYTNFNSNKSTDTLGKNEKKKQIKKIRIKINPEIKNDTMDNNQNLKYNQFNNSILKKNNIETLESLSMHKSPQKTILERYSNDLKIKELKQKLKYMYSYNDSQSSSSKKSSNEISKINILKKRNVENYLKRKIKPIIFLNRYSVMNLSDLKKNGIKSNNERNAKKLIRKKNLSDILFDKSDLTYLSNTKLPSLESLTLSKRKEELKNKRHFVVEYN
jgi:hypothetical protein